jgi:hypothetical protein
MDKITPAVCMPDHPRKIPKGKRTVAMGLGFEVVAEFVCR